MSEGEALSPQAIELSLPWGRIVRGLRWGGSATRVLLLHEPGTDLDAWRSLPPALARAFGAEVEAFDLPGHGLSDDPREPDRLPDVLRALTKSASPDAKLMLVTAGQTAGVALHVAPELPLAGLVCLSPSAGEAPILRSPRVPKLFLAGSIAGDDLMHARLLAGTIGGWTLVTSIPVAERGTALLATDWGRRITEQVTTFLRDCLHPRRHVSPLSSQWERLPPLVEGGSGGSGWG